MTPKQHPGIVKSTSARLIIARHLSRSSLTCKLAQKAQHDTEVVIWLAVLSHGLEAMACIYVPYGQALFAENLRVCGQVISGPSWCGGLTRPCKQLEPVIAQRCKAAIAIGAPAHLITPSGHSSQAPGNILVSPTKRAFLKQARHQAPIEHGGIRLAIHK